MFCFVMFSFFVFFCLFFLGGSWRRKHFLDKDSTRQTFFNPQFKYTTFMYQQHMKDLLVLVLPQEFKTDRFFEADTQCKFKRLLKAGL